MILIQLIILGCLAIIGYQDMFYRAVYWICFPILGLLFVFLKQQQIGIQETLIDTGYSLLFIGVQLFFLWLYFAMKNKKPVNIIKHYLGLGDVLFLFAIAFYLSPANYVVFYVGSLIVVLGYALIQQIVLKKEDLQIPLAGLQAMLLSILLVFSMIDPNLKLYTDFWIYGI